MYTLIFENFQHLNKKRARKKQEKKVHIMVLYYGRGVSGGPAGMGPHLGLLRGWRAGPP